VKYHSMLVFRRVLADETAFEEEPLALEHHEVEDEAPEVDEASHENTPIEEVDHEVEQDEEPEVAFKSKSLGGVTRGDG